MPHCQRVDVTVEVGAAHTPPFLIPQLDSVVVAAARKILPPYHQPAHSLGMGLMGRDALTARQPLLYHATTVTADQVATENHGHSHTTGVTGETGWGFQ
eukprot:NODE_1106_length_1282_cov_53.380373_g905_i0.p1 GENE.NODE_1106_length_1282_cov_53.380373_g905_i0~~NODE_1106_length_1282_cov_53.380373_g905_i0.p1  ORF type:complete len:99 (+),score=10.25 NODE_1106_length_1282_cov_53.380373_g905_i0:545-841(+)